MPRNAEACVSEPLWGLFWAVLVLVLVVAIVCRTSSTAVVATSSFTMLHHLLPALTIELQPHLVLFMQLRKPVTKQVLDMALRSYNII